MVVVTMMPMVREKILLKEKKKKIKIKKLKKKKKKKDEFKKLK